LRNPAASASDSFAGNAIRRLWHQSTAGSLQIAENAFGYNDIRNPKTNVAGA